MSFRNRIGPSLEEERIMASNTQQGALVKNIYYGAYSLPGNRSFKLIQKKANKPGLIDSISAPLIIGGILIFFVLQ